MRAVLAEHRGGFRTKVSLLMGAFDAQLHRSNFGQSSGPNRTHTLWLSVIPSLFLIVQFFLGLDRGSSPDLVNSMGTLAMIAAVVICVWSGYRTCRVSGTNSVKRDRRSDHCGDGVRRRVARGNRLDAARAIRICGLGDEPARWQRFLWVDVGGSRAEHLQSLQPRGRRRRRVRRAPRWGNTWRARHESSEHSSGRASIASKSLTESSYLHELGKSAWTARLTVIAS